MRLTSVLNGPPVFHFWRDFGAGKKRRHPFYKHWWTSWRQEIMKKKVADHTIPTSYLPPNSRVMDAEDFMEGPIDALPQELLRYKQEKIIYDHPWPFNVQLDPIKNQELRHCYSIDTRFFVPRDDCLVLTNTLLESDQMPARPPIEPTDEHLEIIQRQYDWSTKGDSVLVRLPHKREHPKINIWPRAKYGITKERQEVNVMSSMSEFAQTLIAQHYHKKQDLDRLQDTLQRRSIAFPHCHVPFERQNKKMNLDLCIDYLSIGQTPLPLINPNPESTKDRQPISIKPRSWKSLVEQSRQYTRDWSFTMPSGSHIHTIMLASRIKRDHRDTDEMLARSLVHAFGLASQHSRLRGHERQLAAVANVAGPNEAVGKQASVILEDPLSVGDKNLLPEPIVLQTIGFELPSGNFYFTRYQLNSVDFDDTNEARIKNQAWYSGPISDLGEALRYYLDFHAFDQSVASQLNDNQSTGKNQQVVKEFVA